MQIKKITINKFRQLENIVEENIGLINELYGSNGCGKTSFISFITWMLYGETLDYEKNDDMNIDTHKPNELIGGEIILTDKNNEVSLARQFGYNEDGKKTQDFFVNGRKVKKQEEYYNKVFECFNIENFSNLKIKNFSLLRALSDPYYLPQNESQFREFISAILNVDTYAVLFDLDKYQSIKKDYDNQGQSYENCKDFYNQKLKETERDLLNVNSYINSFKTNNIEYNEEEYKNIKEELNKLYNYTVEENNELVDKVKKLNDLQIKLIDSQNKDLDQRKNSNENIKYNNLINQYNLLREEYTNILNENNRKQFRKITIEKEITKLNSELEEVKSSVFKEIRCPQCDCLINEDNYKTFNKNKVEKIKLIKEELNKLNEYLKECERIDLTNHETQLNDYLTQINDLKLQIKSNSTNYTSEETKALENEIKSLLNEVNELKEKDSLDRKQKLENNSIKINELQKILNEIDSYKSKLNILNQYKENKSILLENKSIYELRLSLLNEFKLDEIKLIKNKTSEIFGDDFEFEMLIKNKSNDNYKKVCYASVNGLEHNKSNTAKYLTLSIMLLEKLKEYIGECQLPIIFDIADNIGKQARKKIFEIIKNSQIFYTRICDDEGVGRTLNIIEGEN